MKKGVVSFILLMGCLMAVLFLSACGVGAVDPNEPWPNDQAKITIHGLTEEDFDITLAELKQLKTVTKHAEAPRSNGDIVKVDATGPLLDTFLEQYGKTQKDFSRIRFTARDQYSIAVSAEVLGTRQVILAHQDKGLPLEDEFEPVRVIIPEERAMYWVRNLVRIDFETGGDVKNPNRVVFLDSAADQLPQVDYEYYGSMDKTIQVNDLIDNYTVASDATVINVFLKASDGLQKNETKENFLSGFLKVTGQDAPKFIAEQLPEGMHTRDIIYIIYGETAIFNYATAATCLPLKTEGEYEGLAFTEIFKQTGLKGGNSYKFINTTGESMTLTLNDLGSGGLIYQNEQGVLSFGCTGKTGWRNIDNLLSVEVL